MLKGISKVTTVTTVATVATVTSGAIVAPVTTFTSVTSIASDTNVTTITTLSSVPTAPTVTSDNIKCILVCRGKFFTYLFDQTTNRLTDKVQLYSQSCPVCLSVCERVGSSEFQKLRCTGIWEWYIPSSQKKNIYCSFYLASTVNHLMYLGNK